MISTRAADRTLTTIHLARPTFRTAVILGRFNCRNLIGERAEHLYRTSKIDEDGFRDRIVYNLHVPLIRDQAAVHTLVSQGTRAQASPSHRCRNDDEQTIGRRNSLSRCLNGSSTLSALFDHCCRWKVSSAIGRDVSSASSVTPLWNKPKSWLATICASVLSGEMFSSLHRASIARLNFSRSSESRTSNMFPLPSETISSVKYRAVFLASQEGAIRKTTRIAAGLKDAFGAPAPSLKVLSSFKSEAYAKAESDFADYFARNYPGPDTIIFDPK